MQRCNATVRLGGSLLNTVRKGNVSAAEILILRHIHGHDAVVDVDACGNDRGKANLDEADRLKSVYGGKVFAVVFPGAQPKLPEKLKDVGVDGYADDSDAGPKRGRKSGKKGGKNQDDDATGGASNIGADDITGDDDAPGDTDTDTEQTPGDADIKAGE